MKLYKYIFLILMGSLLMSCEDYLDINVDPNNPTSVTPDLILPTAQNYTARYVTGSSATGRGLLGLGSLFMYNWSETYGFSWYPDEFGYVVTTSFYNGLFDNAYRNALKQYNILDELEGSEYKNYQAIGKIMKAYHFQLLVDLYGDVPYSEALGRSANATPKYDDSQVIYDSLVVELETAVALINEAAAMDVVEVPGVDDGMFNGDMLRWKQFAHSVKLRILVRESDISGNSAKITAGIEAINQEGSGYITSDASVDLGYLNEEGKQTPYWSLYGATVDGTVTLTNDATCATQFILDYLSGTNDARISRLYEEPATGHAGIDQGAPQAVTQSADFVSNIGPGVMSSATQPAVLMTVAENNFNLAEASLKGFPTNGTAEAFYNSGVQASFTQLGAGNATGYLSQPVDNVNYAASADKLEAIITQKWIATNGTTAGQSWFDYNRTGYPSNLPVSMDASSTDRPVRLFYPASERNTNTENVPAQPDAFSSKVFWAQ